MKDIDIYSQMMEDTQPLYLRDPESLEGFIDGPRGQQKAVKVKALQDFKQDLQNADTVDAVCQLYNKIKIRKEGILRYHIENIIYKYGDTRSYKNAVEACYNRIVAGNMLTDFAAYNAASIIFEELVSLKIRDKSELKQYQNTAKAEFHKELMKKKSASEVLKFYDVAAAPNCILQRHFENIIFTHGRTNTYIEAILSVAKRVGELTVFSQGDKLKIQQLYDEIRKTSFFLNGSDISSTLSQLRNILEWEVMEMPPSEEIQEGLKTNLSQP